MTPPTICAILFVKMPRVKPTACTDQSDRDAKSGVVAPSSDNPARVSPVPAQVRAKSLKTIVSDALEDANAYTKRKPAPGLQVLNAACIEKIDKLLWMLMQTTGAGKIVLEVKDQHYRFEEVTFHIRSEHY